jgi:hypothetical protein
MKPNKLFEPPVTQKMLHHIYNSNFGFDNKLQKRINVISEREERI